MFWQNDNSLKHTENTHRQKREMDKTTLPPDNCVNTGRFYIFFFTSNSNVFILSTTVCLRLGEDHDYDNNSNYG